MFTRLCKHDPRRAHDDRWETAPRRSGPLLGGGRRAGGTHGDDLVHEAVGPAGRQVGQLRRRQHREHLLAVAGQVVLLASDPLDLLGRLQRLEPRLELGVLGLDHRQLLLRAGDVAALRQPRPGGQHEQQQHPRHHDGRRPHGGQDPAPAVWMLLGWLRRGVVLGAGDVGGVGLAAVEGVQAPQRVRLGGAAAPPGDSQRTPRATAPRPRKAAASSRSSSMRSSRLYLATRSERAGAPALIWPQLVATARSAIVVSSVSPERCDITLVYAWRVASSTVSSVSVRVPIWLTFTSTLLATPRSMPMASRSALVTKRSSPTSC